MTKEYFVEQFLLDLKTLPHFLAWNKDKMESLAFNKLDLFEVEVALEEVFVNVVNYSGLKASDKLKEELYHTEQLLCIIIEDKGKPFNPLENRPNVDIYKKLEERTEGGLGLFLVHEIMDQMSYERVGDYNRLTLVKYIR